MQKVLSCRPDGRIRRAKVALSTDQKIAKLVHALGMSMTEYKLKADLRALSRVSSRTLLILILSVSTAFGSFAQKVTKDSDGNYVSVTTKRGGTAKNTGKTYTDRQGKKYPVYVTDSGRLFCIKVSKKSGKEYKYYLIEN